MTDTRQTAAPIHPAAEAAREAVRQGWRPEPITDDYRHRVSIGVLGEHHETDDLDGDVEIAIEEIERYARATSTLTADLLHGVLCVRDSNGGIWHPDEDACEEIDRVADAESLAVHICATQPMRGTWAQ